MVARAFGFEIDTGCRAKIGDVEGNGPFFADLELGWRWHRRIPVIVDAGIPRHIKHVERKMTDEGQSEIEE